MFLRKYLRGPNKRSVFIFGLVLSFFCVSLAWGQATELIKDGTRQIYWEDGKPMVDASYKDGKQDGPGAGYLEVLLRKRQGKG